MYKKICKGIASILGAALMLGCVVTSAVPAQAVTANGNETTYNMNELTMDGKDDSAEVAASGSAVSLTYGGNWGTVYYAVPAEVMAAGLKGATCNIDSTNNLVVKFCSAYNTSDASSSDIGDVAVFGKAVDLSNVDASEIAKIKYIGVAGQENASFKLDSITFVTENPVTLPGDNKDDADDGNDNDDADDTDDVAADDNGSTSSKTGESLTNLYVVCALGGLLLIAAAGTFVTEQKKRR